MSISHSLHLLHRGEFSDGGAIAVECSPLLVAEVETKGRFGKVDGRFPHWVTPYNNGDRYSLIYVSFGSVHFASKTILELITASCQT